MHILDCSDITKVSGGKNAEAAAAEGASIWLGIFMFGTLASIAWGLATNPQTTTRIGNTLVTKGDFSKIIKGIVGFTILGFGLGVAHAVSVFSVDDEQLKKKM